MGSAGAMAEREDWYARAAAVGRAGAGQNAGYLAQRIAEQQQALQQCAATGACTLPFSSPYTVRDIHQALADCPCALLDPVSIDAASRCVCGANLYRCLSTAIMHLWAEYAGQDPSEALEALHWLTRMSAHFLADSGDGEVPYPPMAVAHAAASSPPCRDPVEALAHSLLGVLGLCLDERGSSIASPR